jgi:GT2 family glycosyltransferase
LSVKNNDPLISIIIVNYKVPDELCQLLRSLRQAELYEKTETIIVDNASEDNSQEMVTRSFPEVSWIALKNNIGFGKACNVATQNSKGKYLLFINPDTLISNNTLRISLDFMENHSDVGIMGPKIIKPDGSFQPYCRRSFPTPLIAFTYMFGINKIFPKNKLFGKYHYTHIDPDTSMEVDAISGSFMFMRHSLFTEMGGFDKSFFMYGEDLDLCARCREHGYKVWYNHATQIVHFKGKSCTKNLVRSRIAFYEAMILFSKKYRHSYGTFFPGWFLTLGIFFQAALNLGTIFFKSYTACFIDFILINATIIGVTVLRFQQDVFIKFYSTDSLKYMFILHLLISLCFLFTYAYRGIYSTERYSARNALFSGLAASIIFLTGIYFIKIIAYSRIVFGVSAIIISLILVGWRELLPRIVANLKQRIYFTGKVLIIGNNNIASALIKEKEKDKTAQIYGIIWPLIDSNEIPGEFEGYPVLGGINNLSSVLKKQKTDLLLIATTESWYSAIIEALTFLHLKQLTIQWVPHELFNKPVDQIPESIPLNDFSV